MRELLHFHTNRQGGVQNPDGEIVSIKNRWSPHRPALWPGFADFRSRLSGGAWLSPSCCGRFPRFGCGRFPRFGCGRFPRFGCDRFSRFGCGRFSRFGCDRFSRFGHGFNRSRQFRLRRFRSAMVAMVQRLDARGFFFRPQLSVCKVSALVLEVFRNRFSCHGSSVAELCSSELSNFGHSLTIHGPLRGDWTERRTTGSHRHLKY
jgi:hypothetical protein